MSEYLILRHRAIPGLERLSVYLEHQGFTAFKKAVTELQPAQIIQMVKDS
ncbi:MAG: NADH-quinone oxidoreductase subunit F, partial [Thermanaerothrix sp.]|nr:NADH-quinone oxidoreductase subunit F [Thermanaerothrix sp.]